MYVLNIFLMGDIYHFGFASRTEELWNWAKQLSKAVVHNLFSVTLIFQKTKFAYTCEPAKNDSVIFLLSAQRCFELLALIGNPQPLLQSYSRTVVFFFITNLRQTKRTQHVTIVFYVNQF